MSSRNSAVSRMPRTTQSSWSRAARSSSGSSMSVMFWTYATSWPRSRQYRLTRSKALGRRVAEVGGVVGRDAADIHQGGGPGIGGPDLAGGRVVQAQRRPAALEPGKV